MNYLIIYQEEPIGTMAEPESDQGMGMVSGTLIPNPAYEKVRAVFRLYAESSINLANLTLADSERLSRFFRERDALRLSVTTEGNFPVPVSWVHISDFSKELGDSAYEADFHVDSPAFFEDPQLWNGKDQWNTLKTLRARLP